MQTNDNIPIRPKGSRQVGPKNSELHICGESHGEDLQYLAQMLKDLPDRTPPRDLAEAVVDSIEPKTLSFWRRVFLWLATPRPVTISPIRVAAVLTATVLVVMLVTLSNLLGPKIADIPSGREEAFVSVLFSFYHPQARSVSLIGSFNQWNPEGFEMQPQPGSHRWLLELRLPPGRHTYAFLIDGSAAVADPDCTFSESDGFGNKNSILFIKNGNAHAI
jgi:hypothetical protein